MAKLYGDIASSALMTFDKSFARANGQPLDSTEIYYSLEEAKAYAASAGAYVGQKIAVVENNVVTHYSIEDTTGTLKELGVKPIGDNKTIQVDEEGVISLVNTDEAKALSLPRMKADKSGIEWVSLSTVTQGDGNTTYEFELNETGTGFIVTPDTGEQTTKPTLELDTESQIVILKEGSIIDYYEPVIDDEFIIIFSPNGNSGQLIDTTDVANWLDPIIENQHYVQFIDASQYPEMNNSGIYKIESYSIIEVDGAKVVEVIAKEYIVIPGESIEIQSTEIDFANTFTTKTESEETTNSINERLDLNDERMDTTDETISVINQTVQNNSYITERALLKSEKGAKDGLAPLDETGLIPAAYLPSYVDDVIVGHLYLNPNENSGYEGYVSGDFYEKFSDQEKEVFLFEENKYIYNLGFKPIDLKINTFEIWVGENIISSSYYYIDPEHGTIDFSYTDYVDDNIGTEFVVYYYYYENLISAETGKIYVDYNSGKTYRFSGNSVEDNGGIPLYPYYVEISSSLSLGETESTAYSGKKGAANAAAIAVLNGDSTGSVKKTVSDAISNIPASSDTTKGLAQVDNSTIVSNDGVLSVNQINTDALVQGTNTLILCGGNASGFTNI